MAGSSCAPPPGRRARSWHPRVSPPPHRRRRLERAEGDPAGPQPADAILAFVDPAHAVVRLSAPLQRGGQTIGLLAIGGATARGFDADEVETLASLANQATIALEHARLEDRLRELAVVEERERIARELHDGIAQVLGYVNTKSQAIDGYLAHGRVDEARVQVAELGAAARAVYVDVREAILGLRSPIEPGQGLGAAAQAYAQRVAADSPFVLDVDISRRGPRPAPGRGGRGAGLPHRPGGAHERAQARLGPAGPDVDGRGRRPDGRADRRRRPGVRSAGHHRRRRPLRPAVDARAGGRHRRDARRPPRLARRGRRRAAPAARRARAHRGRRRGHQRGTGR